MNETQFSSLLVNPCRQAHKSNARRPLAALFGMLFSWLLFSAGGASAAQFGDFTYVSFGGSAYITGFSNTATGSVEIPETIEGDTVAGIFANAFANCSGVTSVSIPSGVESIGAGAFSPCAALATFSVDAANPNFSSVNGMLTNKEETLLLFCPGASAGAVTVPSSIAAIGDGAFAGCSAMTSLTIPSGVETIGLNAFAPCSALTSFSVDGANANFSSVNGLLTNKAGTVLLVCPGGLAGELAVPAAITQIGDGAFYFCSALTSVVIPNGVTSVGSSAFLNCTALTSVNLPSGVSTIQANTFYECVNLTSVSIPASVASIGTYAFYNCGKLGSLTLPSGLVVIGDYAFRNCVTLTGLTLPGSLTTIGANAFFQCRGLTSMTIPSSVTSIGTGAFYSCSGLTSIAIPSSVNVIPPAAFYSCSGLVSITIPSSVTSIGAEAFRYCSSLTSITMPSSLTVIGARAFFSCSALTSIQIPAGVTSIGSSAFAFCSAMTTIGVDSGNPNFASVSGLLTNKAKTSLIACPAGKSGAFLIPAGIASIGAAAFLNCEKLTSVTFPASVTSIAAQAFSGCSLLMQANFTGDAPTMGFNVFELTPTGFAIYYSSTASGFTSPTWYGYDSYSTVVSSNPIATWLISKGLPTNSSLSSDTNGDGVNLLMAYALNLDPNENLSTSVPGVVFSPSEMSMSYYSAAAGVTYVVEVSSNMLNWSSAGVSTSAPDLNHVVTATAPRTGSGRFMRLTMSY